MHPRKPRAHNVAVYCDIAARRCSARPRGRERDSMRPGSRWSARSGGSSESLSDARRGGRFIFFLEFRSFWSHVLTNTHIGHGATPSSATRIRPLARADCDTRDAPRTSAGATSATGAPSASAAPTSRSTTDTSPPAARSLPPGRGADGVPLGCSPCRAALTRPSVPAAC